MVKIKKVLVQGAVLSILIKNRVCSVIIARKFEKKFTKWSVGGGVTFKNAWREIVLEDL